LSSKSNQPESPSSPYFSNVGGNMFYDPMSATYDEHGMIIDEDSDYFNPYADRPSVVPKTKKEKEGSNKGYCVDANSEKIYNWSIPIWQKNVKYDKLNKEEFKHFWDVLVTQSATELGRKNNAGEQCALKKFKQYLITDHNDKVMYDTKNKTPVGFNCDENPIRNECISKEVSKKPLKQFVKWVTLLNKGYDQVKFRKQDITPNSKHYELQEKYNWEFAYPDKEDEQKKFMDKMNIAACNILLQINAKSRMHTDIVKKSETETARDEILESQAIEEEEIEDAKRKPLLFLALSQKVNSMVPLDNEKASEITYMIKKYDPEYKEKLLNSPVLTKEEKEIINNYYDASDNNKYLNRLEEDSYNTQLNELGKEIKSMLTDIAKEQNLCESITSNYDKDITVVKSKKDPYSSNFIAMKMNKKKNEKNLSINKPHANHFNFTSSVCANYPNGLDRNYREFNVEPLFDGWAGGHQSTNGKLVSIQTKENFIKEFNTDSTVNEPEAFTGLNLQQRINYADNTPLIFTLGTGYAVTSAYDRDKTLQKEEHTTKIDEDKLVNEDINEDGSFHNCALKWMKDYVQNKEFQKDVMIENNITFPIEITTKKFTSNTETKLSKVRSATSKPKITEPLYGVQIKWGVLPNYQDPQVDFRNLDIGKIFNYNQGLDSLKNFLSRRYNLQNEIINQCSVIGKQRTDH
jgi:hypothetical protein